MIEEGMKMAACSESQCVYVCVCTSETLGQMRLQQQTSDSWWQQGQNRQNLKAKNMALLKTMCIQEARARQIHLHHHCHHYHCRRPQKK